MPAKTQAKATVQSKPVKGKTAKATPQPAGDLDPSHSVMVFFRGLIELLPEGSVPERDQTELVAVAVRMTAADRDSLLRILRNAAG